MCSAFDLTASYQKALSFNADYLASIANNQAGQEAVVQGQAQLLPQLSAGAGVNEAYLASGSSNVSYYQPIVQAQLQQVVVDFNKFSNFSKSKFATQLSDLEFINARQQLIVQVGQAYFELLNAEDMLQSVKMTKNALNQQLEQANTAFRVGTITIADVNDAKSGYDTATAEEIQSENEVINKKNIFANITGMNPEMVQPILESIDLTYPNPDSVDEWAQMAKMGNISIKIAAKKMSMAAEDISIAKSGHLPVVSFVGSYVFQGTANITGTDSVATQQLVNTLQTIPGFPLSTYTGVGALLQVNIPIYSGGNVSSQVRQQINLYEAARDDLLETTRQTDKNIRNAFLEVHNGVEEVKALSQALNSARIKLQSDKTGYRVGVRNSINLVNSEKNYYQTWQSYNQARYQYLIARLQLEYLAGRIDDDFLNMINANIKQ
jgi:outer membrane protein